MFCTLPGVLTLLAWCLAFQAPDPAKDQGKDKKPDTPLAREKALEEEFNKAQQDFFKAYAAAKTEAEKEKVANEKYPDPANYVDKFIKLAEENPKDPAAVKALVWVVTRARSTPGAKKALEVLARDHITDEEMGAVAQSLLYTQAPDVEKLLRNIIAKNTHHKVQGMAQITLARYLKNHARGKEPPAEVEKLLEEVAAKYADVPSYRGTLADQAKAELFELHNLIIGKIAPDIMGEDIDGQKMSLNDYRGKVVVLDFWGNW